MKTLMPKQLKGNERNWYVIDAAGQNLGRISTLIATYLKGKNKVNFAPHVDNGDYVIVLNAGKITVTGNKESQKLYRSHSQYMGGLKETPLAKMREKKPTEILRHAVSGMLPKNRLHDGMISRLKLELGSEHQYQAQQPTTITL